MRIQLLALSLLSLIACNGTDGETTDSGGTDDTDSTDDSGSTDDTDDTDAEVLELIGSYANDFGGTLDVTAESIDETGGQGDTAYSNAFAISQFDNEGTYVIAQNDAGNAYNPSQWSRFDWTVDADSKWWICQTAYDAATEQDAADTPAADASDPANSGCGGFGWTGLTKN